MDRIEFEKSPIAIKTDKIELSESMKTKLAFRLETIQNGSTYPELVQACYLEWRLKHFQRPATSAEVEGWVAWRTKAAFKIEKVSSYAKLSALGKQQIDDFRAAKMKATLPKYKDDFQGEFDTTLTDSAGMANFTEWKRIESWFNLAENLNSHKQAFSKLVSAWLQDRYGKPVVKEGRVIGFGTSCTMDSKNHFSASGRAILEITLGV